MNTLDQIMVLVGWFFTGMAVGWTLIASGALIFGKIENWQLTKRLTKAEEDKALRQKTIRVRDAIANLYGKEPWYSESFWSFNNTVTVYTKYESLPKYASNFIHNIDGVEIMYI